MIFVLLIILVVAGIIFSRFFEYRFDGLSTAFSVVGLFAIATVIILGVVAIVVHNPLYQQSKLYEYQERYNTITYSINNNPQNIIIMSDDIAAYNSDVLGGRLIQNDVWFGVLSCDFYNDLELINLEENK